MFEITSKSTQCKARTGIIHTAHGDIETPIFMPVGTQATVKSLDPNDLNNIGAQIILSNTYHLHLRPGEDLIAEFDGLHKFMGWNKPILTDSGGFQVFSLKNVQNSKKNENTKDTNDNVENQHNQGRLVNIDDDGVTFHSHLDGSTHRFTPESAIEIEHKLGADIIMAFDECTGDDVCHGVAKAAMDRTHAWAERSLIQHQKIQETNTEIQNDNQQTKNNFQFLFGIIQGSNYQDLREESARFISSLDFDGIAIGGESIGFNMEATKNILDWVIPLIPENKPHYTMGVGFSPANLFEVVERGVDMFDCVSPTRMARNGALFVKNHERININNSQFIHDHSPIDSACSCYTCQNFSRAYLNHLFKAEELLSYRLATIHNLHFLLDLMSQMRQAIREDKFLELKKQWL